MLVSLEGAFLLLKGSLYMQDVHWQGAIIFIIYVHRLQKQLTVKCRINVDSNEKKLFG